MIQKGGGKSDVEMYSSNKLLQQTNILGVTTEANLPPIYRLHERRQADDQ